MSFRITSNFFDLSQTVPPPGSVFGATVIKSGKGPSDFFFFSKGESQKIIDTFGIPSATYPAIQDLLDSNASVGMWVCSPITSGKYGGVWVTEAGTIPFVNGTSAKTIANYSAIPCTQTLGLGNGTTLIFTTTLPSQKTYYKPNSLTLSVAGTPVAMTPTGTSTETYTGTNLTVTYVLATGVVTATWGAGHAPTGALEIGFSLDLSAIIYFTLFDAYPQADDLAVLVEANTNIEGNFFVHVYRNDPVQGSFLEIPGSPIEVGLSEDAVNGNGQNVYIGNVFGPSNQVMFAPTVQNSTFTTFTDDTEFVELAGGDRGTTPSDSAFATKFAILADKNTYPVSVIFDTTAGPLVAAQFETLRNGTLNRTRFALPTTDVPPATIITTPATYNNGIHNRGIYYYCLTWGLKKNIYTGVSFNCSNMGLVASKLLNMLIFGPGGSPAWFDENNVGGQLGGSIIKLNQTVTDDQLRQLDALRFNSIINHSVAGVMIENARTTLIQESDYSYIGQSSLADFIVKQIEDNVLPFQIWKLNDSFHQGQVKAKAETILRSVSTWLTDFVVQCDGNNNTAAVLQAQQFVLTIVVIFSKYASRITLNFVNAPSGSDVQEVISKSFQ